jgi:hypothetical protein
MFCNVFGIFARLGSFAFHALKAGFIRHAMAQRFEHGHFQVKREYPAA